MSEQIRRGRGCCAESGRSEARLLLWPFPIRLVVLESQLLERLVLVLLHARDAMMLRVDTLRDAILHHRVRPGDGVELHHGARLLVAKRGAAAAKQITRLRLENVSGLRLLRLLAEERRLRLCRSEAETRRFSLLAES